MRTPLIAGNWKMNLTLPEARALVSAMAEGIADIEGADVLICPPFTLLFPMAKAVAGTRIMLGAQNAHEEPSGAFTGDVSVPMIKDTGCTHVIIGHSERRRYYGEGGTLLARKVRAVVKAEMDVIYCVGETLEDREASRTEAVVERQMNEVINRDVVPQRVIIAYEPVWAIGTGRTATPKQAEDVHSRIRAVLAETYDPATSSSIRILYGGSVKPDNATELLRQPNIDGALVGGACLAASSMLSIIAAASVQAASA